MASADSESIDGLDVLEPTSDMWIPCKSRSDALLAHLYLTDNFSVGDMDLILEVVNNPASLPRRLLGRKRWTSKSTYQKVEGALRLNGHRKWLRLKACLP